MKYLLMILCLGFSGLVYAADGEPTEYFGALWDFIDWVYEALDEFKQTVLDYMVEISKVILLWYIEWKVHTVIFVWSVIEPLIDSLNLTDVISNLFGFLSSDIKAFMTELRIGEAINLLISAYITRAILRMTGF